MEIEIAKLVRLPIFQVRKELSGGTVESYKQGFKADGSITRAPILVGRIVPDEQERPRDRVKKVPMGSLVLLAGFHRVEACLQLGRKTILAEIIDVPLRRARWIAAKSNMTHGLPLKRSERREAFREFLRAGEWKRHKGLRSIASEMGVHHSTIALWMGEREFHRIRARFSREIDGAKGKEFTGDYPPPPTQEHQSMKMFTDALENMRNFWPSLSPQAQQQLREQISETYRLFQEGKEDDADPEGDLRELVEARYPRDDLGGLSESDTLGADLEDA